MPRLLSGLRGFRSLLENLFPLVVISSPVGAELELQYSSSSNEYGKFLCSVVIFISFAMAGICQYVSYYSVKLIPYLYIYICMRCVSLRFSQINCIPPLSQKKV